MLLEPVMEVSITIPETMMGDILGDLNTRRAQVQGMDTVGRRSIVKAKVPFSEMMRYGNDLRSMTGGRGTFSAVHDHYDILPSHLESKIKTASNGSH